MDIYNSRFAKRFVRQQGMISISTTRFGFGTGLFKLLAKPRCCLNCTKAGVQNRHIMAISVHSNEHSIVSCNKRPSEDQLSDGMLRHHLAKP